MTSSVSSRRLSGLSRLCGPGLLVFMLLVAGCAHRGPRPGEGPDIPGPPQPTLAGEGVFFGGTFVASARVRAPQAGPHPGGGKGPGLGGGGGPRGGGPDKPGGERGSQGMRVPAMPPRQELVVSFRNTGPASVDVHVVEVKSIMGNFVPVPGTFSVDPGRTQTLEGMRSALDNLGRLDLSLTLRSGEVREQQVIVLEIAEEPADTRPPSP